MISKKDIIDAFNFRHACKEFDFDKKIPREDFEFILETARLSPSSFGFEPWKIIVLQKDELREKLNNIIWGAKKILPTCSHYIIILAKKKTLFSKKHIIDFSKNIQKLNQKHSEAKLLKFSHFMNNDFEIEKDKDFFEWSCRQTYIMLANMMSSAAIAGIDSCAVEGFNKKIMDNFLAENLDVDISKYGTSVMCGFGYRINMPKPKTRQKIEDIVTYY